MISLTIAHDGGPDQHRRPERVRHHSRPGPRDTWIPPLPEPKPAAETVLADKPVSADERKQLAGTFVLKLDKVGAGANLHDSFAQYRRTYRDFDENGRLMIQPLGEARNACSSRMTAALPCARRLRRMFHLRMKDMHTSLMKIDSPGFPLAGERVGDGDPATFHRQLR